VATIDDAEMWVVSAEDLILSKLEWARASRSEVQFRDVRNMIAAQTSLDWSYLDGWAARIGVAALLAEVRQ
jgi:hypothetical protein